MAPSHYLNCCWLIAKWNQKTKNSVNYKSSRNIFQQNIFGETVGNFVKAPMCLNNTLFFITVIKSVIVLIISPIVLSGQFLSLLCWEQIPYIFVISILAFLPFLHYFRLYDKIIKCTRMWIRSHLILWYPHQPWTCWSSKCSHFEGRRPRGWWR